jgi:signal transduction histidine kinase
MNTSLILEWVVLGGAFFSFLYHFVLYIHQKDRYLLLYVNYLFSISLFISFRRFTNYDSFEISNDKLAFTLDYPLILYMLVSYVFFMSTILEEQRKAKIINFAAISFYVISAIFFTAHLYKVFFTDATNITKDFFTFTKLILVFIAFTGLIGAWHITKTVFTRIILGGGFFYAFFSLLTIFSVYYDIRLLGLYKYDLYFVGCFLDVLMFSSALGYRTYLINQEKMITQSLLIEASQKNEELLLEKQSILELENVSKKNQIEMNRIIQNDVGASLSSIHVFADLAANLIESQPTKSKEYLKRIAIQSQNLMDELGDLIWIANLAETNRHEALIERLKDYGQPIFDAQDSTVTFEIEKNIYGISLDNEELISIISKFKNDLREIVKDQKTKKYFVQFKVTDSKIKLSMSTNGGSS